MTNERFFQGIYYDNLGIDYSSPTFTIQGANGRSLSASNPAVIVLPSKANPGQFTKYQVTADQSFDDDSGTSDIAGNDFGTTSGRAWSNACPFYLYAVTNDAESTIQFMISRIPHAKISPAAANIGAPDDAVADAENYFWSLSNIDETLYDSNPCICIGSFRMVKSASDDWTVQTLTLSNSAQDGIGQFNESAWFTYPSGHDGNDASSYFQSNAGTAPVFTNESIFYRVLKNGTVDIEVEFSGDGGTDGSGAVTVEMGLPFEAEYNVTNVVHVNIGSGILLSQGGTSSGTNIGFNAMVNPSDNDVMYLYPTPTASLVQYGDFTNGNRLILFSGNYPIAL